MDQKWHILSQLIWTPFLGGLIILLVKNILSLRLIKIISLLICVYLGFLSVDLYSQFNPVNTEMQFLEHYSFLPPLNAYYSLGIDGLALPLILLNVLITFIAVISSYQFNSQKLPEYLALFLILSGLVTGVFCATDSLLFFVFWEAILIPMFLIIGIFGGNNRHYASIKFFIYTFLGSIFLLLAILYLRQQASFYLSSHDFSIEHFYQLSLPLAVQKWLFFAFFLAFAVKIPMWPLHTWLPDAHVEAPTEGSIILAAVLLKLGAYGFIRFLLPIAPLACQYFSGFIIVLSLIAIIYIGLIAIVQQDLKKLIAYSSISHMGFVSLGLFISVVLFYKNPQSTNYSLGFEGAYAQMISHGFISGALFLAVGTIYQRMHTRSISELGGIVNTMPIFSAFFMLFAMSNLALPGTSGFIGEFLVILASFHINFWVSFGAALTLVLGASYTLWMYKRVIFGQITNAKVSVSKDISFNEKILFSILSIGILGLGLKPSCLLDIVEPSVRHLFVDIIQPKLLANLQG
ncbi:MAG: NADH:ubiquinone oxidoreductase subunit [Francisellaceae bacterium]|nr:NADH:ubiquinone oxidoreductase subunit [Francisellaceae bacterium]